MALTLLLGPVSSARTNDACRPANCREIACLVEQVGCLIAAGRAEEAVALLKPRKAEGPALVRMLAWAYLAAGNPFWAQRVLTEAQSRYPEDCEARGLLAWVLLSQGFADLATEALRVPPCPRSPADRGQALLIEALVARARDGPRAALALVRAAGAEAALYPEDRALRLRLLREDPLWAPPLETRLALTAGATSNALAGSPVETSGASSPSVFARLDLNLTLSWPTVFGLTPRATASLEGLWLAASEVHALSYWAPTGKAFVTLDTGLGLLSAGYRFDSLWLDRPGESRFYTSHAGELALAGGRFALFANASRRDFSYTARTRTEIRLGSGFTLSLRPDLRLLLGGAARLHLANSEAYDLLGGALASEVELDLPWGFGARLGLALAADHYFHSDSPAGFAEFDVRQARADIVTRPSFTLKGPRALGVEVDLRYEFGWRWSTAAAPGRDFNALEHSVSLTLRFAAEVDPLSPQSLEKPDHVPLDYGLRDRRGSSGERLEELLRQEESDRGESCGCTH